MDQLAWTHASAVCRIPKGILMLFLKLPSIFLLRSQVPGPARLVELQGQRARSRSWRGFEQNPKKVLNSPGPPPRTPQEDSRPPSHTLLYWSRVVTGRGESRGPPFLSFVGIAASTCPEGQWHPGAGKTSHPESPASSWEVSVSLGKARSPWHKVASRGSEAPSLES